MTLEYEKLTAEIENMARGAYQQQQRRQELVETALEKLRAFATDWDRIETSLLLAQSKVDQKLLRTARPLDDDEPMDAAVGPPVPPPQAKLIAVDGSQILPDRHAAFLYYLINVGVVVYYHGQGRAPHQFSQPTLGYPNGDVTEGEEEFVTNSAIVSLWRDLAEIEALAATAWQSRREAAISLALLDQRLLYWPTFASGNSEGRRVLTGWQKAMTKIRDSGSTLAGYIDRPGKRSLITLLHALDIQEPGFDVELLIRRNDNSALTDATLFREFLRPGQRSKVFVDVSEHNSDFRDQDPLNEVCFFYLNPGRAGRQIARVDIPLWVAQDPEAVAAVHGLVYSQCQILGDYPYVLTRADEVAVVGRQDQSNLNIMIENAMQHYGIAGEITAKQSGKEIARAGKSRHEV